MERTFSYNGYWFEWSGGQYIDIHHEGESTPFDVINVKGMDGKLLIERSTRGFHNRCKRWYREVTA